MHSSSESTPKDVLSKTGRQQENPFQNEQILFWNRMFVTPAIGSSHVQCPKIGPSERSANYSRVLIIKIFVEKSFKSNAQNKCIVTKKVVAAISQEIYISTSGGST